jgi:hypothetical protein
LTAHHHNKTDHLPQQNPTTTHNKIMLFKQLINRSLSSALPSQRRLLSAAAPIPGRPNRVGPNGVVGGTVFAFVGGVYYYTVYMLRKQGDELMDELDDLEKEIENENK